ncbi:hypothetical protein [Ruegeria arenilitoris]|uniref:hypothetical protein n=1 Tax=Ruegeria arenilitoris TaxID=1173585 RepID=UPI003464973A
MIAVDDGADGSDLRGRPKSLFKESSAGTMQSLDRALGVPTATTHRILATL